MLTQYRCVTLYLAVDTDTVVRALAHMEPQAPYSERWVAETEPWQYSWKRNDVHQLIYEWFVVCQIPRLGSESIGGVNVTALHDMHTSLVMYNRPGASVDVYWMFIGELRKSLLNQRIIPRDTPKIDEIQIGWYRQQSGILILCSHFEKTSMEASCNKDVKTIRALVNNIAAEWESLQRRMGQGLYGGIQNIVDSQYLLIPDTDLRWTISLSTPAAPQMVIGSVEILPDGSTLRFSSPDESTWLNAQPCIAAILHYLAKKDALKSESNDSDAYSYEVVTRVRIAPCQNRERRQKVLDMRMAYRHNEEIADELYCSVDTVKNDVRWLRKQHYLPTHSQ